MDSEDGRTQSRPATPGSISFVGLPKGIRQDIYKRVLVVAHPIYLFQDGGSRVETFAPDRPTRWLALLYVNQQVRGEARAVLYGMNRFNLVDTRQQEVGLLRSFLNCIGFVNADLLSHLSISFPVAERMEDQPGEVKIREDGLQSLRLLQEKCTNLTTLEMFIHSKNSSFLTKTDEDSSHLAQEALPRIDAQLKAIPSLKKIIVRVYIGALPPLVTDLMQGLGWVVLFGDRSCN
ncbi:hypothetical protein QBC46DRAFT_318122 [Diplogelasinospora grovesii]|uniref:Uncharacterized protein n=1 Tax=Diplogelasinospora grovesii TaxID=303347 RepID=A0AAN6N2Y3_9PEZI|nr:hypothetical protein QBC46DRAFT_318122 [Diplogelasinospora grovesii]